MRKYINIIEQTMLTGRTSGAMKQVFDHFVSLKNDFQSVGEMDFDWTILRKDEETSSVFLIGRENEIAAYYQVKFLPDNLVELLHAYVDPVYRGQHLTEKFCWFLQTREGSRILFGDKLSPDAILLANSLYRSQRFKLWWVKDNEKEPYRPDETPEYDDDQNVLGHLGFDKPTGWRLIAENIAIGTFPHFNQDLVNILSETYCLFDHY